MATENQFNLIVAGGRDFTDQERVRAEMFAYAEAMGDDKEISVISGMARGADLAAYWVCKAEGIHCIEMPADWKGNGKAAGFIRNRAMAVQAHGLLAFLRRENPTKGTSHMIECMRAMGKPVHIVYY